MASVNASIGMPSVRVVRADRGERRAGELGVPEVLLGRHLAGDLVGQVVHVLGRPDQRHDGEVDLDEVREVAELVEPPQLLQVAGHRARVPGGQLADDPRRRRADVVDVQLDLGQSADELLEAGASGRFHTTTEPPGAGATAKFSTPGRTSRPVGTFVPTMARTRRRSWIRLLPWAGTAHGHHRHDERKQRMSKQSRIRTQELRQAQLEAAARKARQRRIVQVVGGLVILGLVVAIVVAVINATGGSDRDVEEPTGEVVVPQNLTESGAVPVGATDAPVTVEIYYDYMCPACGAFEAVNGDELDRLMNEGVARIELRPISFLDEQSEGTRYSTRAANAFATVVDGAPDVRLDLPPRALRGPARGGHGRAQRRRDRGDRQRRRGARGRGRPVHRGRLRAVGRGGHHGGVRLRRHGHPDDHDRRRGVRGRPVHRRRPDRGDRVGRRRQ